MSKQVYNNDFYKNRNKKTEYSANTILRIVFEKLSKRNFNSMVDVGCGIGTWLRVAHTNYNVSTIVGLDGDYVPRQYLQIEDKYFIPSDLEQYHADMILKKFLCEENRKFDIAISLEVAEHISKEHASSFVNNLCKLSDIVLFSAAIPGQGGKGHVNEQRLSYWVNLFEKNGYQLYDVIRATIWNDLKIPVWYRNNVVVFYNKSLGKLIDTTHCSAIVDVVHPDLFENQEVSLKYLLKERIRKIGRKK